MIQHTINYIQERTFHMNHWKEVHWVDAFYNQRKGFICSYILHRGVFHYLVMDKLDFDFPHGECKILNPAQITQLHPLPKNKAYPYNPDQIIGLLAQPERPQVHFPILETIKNQPARVQVALVQDEIGDYYITRDANDPEPISPMDLHQLLKKHALPGKKFVIY